MTEYVAPANFPYVDLPDTSTPVYADDFANPIVESLLELAGAGGRVPALETSVAALGSGATYTDENARDAIGAAFAAGTHTGITVTVNDGADSISLATSSASLPVYGPADLGWLTWSIDPAVASSSSAPNGAGIMALTRVKLPTAATVTSICLYVATAGATLTSGQCFAGLFDSTGARVGVTADLSTVVDVHRLQGARPDLPVRGGGRVVLGGAALQRDDGAAVLPGRVQPGHQHRADRGDGPVRGLRIAQTTTPSSITPASIVITSAGANTVSFMVGLK
jgi:hypothetical protein